MCEPKDAVMILRQKGVTPPNPILCRAGRRGSGEAIARMAGHLRTGQWRCSRLPLWLQLPARVAPSHAECLPLLLQIPAGSGMSARNE